MTKTATKKVAPVTLVAPVVDSPAWPGLDRVGTRLARGVAEFLTGLMAVPASVASSPVRMEESEPVEGAAFRHLRIAPLNGVITVAIDRAAIMRLVDVYYGGDGSGQGSRKSLSPAEDRFFSRIARALCDVIPTAWMPFGTITAGVEDEGSASAAPVAVQVLTVSWPDWPAFDIECRYPVAMLQAVPELCSAASQQGGDGFADHNWQARLMEGALNIPMPVRAIFAEPDLPIARLMNLRAGEIIPICLPSQIELRVAGLTYARGSVGESNGRAAVKIEHFQRSN
jgi:flagellar motor switch protein FliM